MKDLSNIEWLSKKGSRNYFQNLIFTTFHRVLDTLVVGSNMSLSLILIQFIQLGTMLVNEKNPNLSKVLPRDLLYYIKFPLVYPFLKDVNFIYTLILAIPILIFLGMNIYLFFKLYNLSEKSHKEYGSTKRLFGICMYFIDTILVIPMFGVCFKLMVCGDLANQPSCNSTSFFIYLILSLILLITLFVIEMCVGMFFFNFDFLFNYLSLSFRWPQGGFGE